VGQLRLPIPTVITMASNNHATTYLALRSLIIELNPERVISRATQEEGMHTETVTRGILTQRGKERRDATRRQKDGGKKMGNLNREWTRINANRTGI